MSTNSSPPQNFLFRQKRSQAAVEFALSFPILLMIIFGIIDFSLLFAGWLAIENLARQEVRYAATGQYDKSFCPADDGSTSWRPDCTGDNTDGDGGNVLSTREKEIDIARLKSIHAVGENWHTLINITDG